MHVFRDSVSSLTKDLPQCRCVKKVSQERYATLIAAQTDLWEQRPWGNDTSRRVRVLDGKCDPKEQRKNNQ
jgi:hypothetical protein